MSVSGTVDKTNQAYGSIVSSSQSESASPLVSSLLGKQKTPEELRRDGEILDWEDRDVRLAADGGTAEVAVDKNRVIVASDQNTGIGVGDGAVIIKGKVSFDRQPDDIVFSGFWRLNQECLTTIPSTLSNPVQTLIYKYPNYVKKVSKIAQIFA